MHGGPKGGGGVPRWGSHVRDGIFVVTRPGLRIQSRRDGLAGTGLATMGQGAQCRSAGAEAESKRGISISMSSLTGLQAGGAARGQRMTAAARFPQGWLKGDNGLGGPDPALSSAATLGAVRLSLED